MTTQCSEILLMTVFFKNNFTVCISTTNKVFFLNKCYFVFFSLKRNFLLGHPVNNILWLLLKTIFALHRTLCVRQNCYTKSNKHRLWKKIFMILWTHFKLKKKTGKTNENKYVSNLFVGKLFFCKINVNH